MQMASYHFLSWSICIDLYNTKIRTIVVLAISQNVPGPLLSIKKTVVLDKFYYFEYFCYSYNAKSAAENLITVSLENNCQQIHNLVNREN